MGKLEVFDGKQTTWEGLWWHPEYAGFSSAPINLSKLKKFKGNVILYVRKNKFYNKGENNRPNYCFCLKDSKSLAFTEIGIQDDTANNRCIHGSWQYNEETDLCTTTWFYSCSECGYKTVNHECYELPKFCPNCGAKMD